jgi:hypothetical protein
MNATWMREKRICRNCKVTFGQRVTIISVVTLLLGGVLAGITIRRMRHFRETG